MQKTLFFGLSKGIVIVLILAVIETPCFFQIAKASPLIDNIKQQQHSIQICCSWGKKLVDGVLTYKIIGGDVLTQMAVRNAINEWNAKVMKKQTFSSETSGLSLASVCVSHLDIR